MAGNDEVSFLVRFPPTPTEEPTEGMGEKYDDIKPLLTTVMIPEIWSMVHSTHTHGFIVLPETIAPSWGRKSIGNGSGKQSDGKTHPFRGRGFPAMVLFVSKS